LAKFHLGKGGEAPRCIPRGEEETIAIYSLNIRSVGRSTHAARTAGAHIRYITRPDAQAEIMAERMPAGRNAARRWLDRQERADRKNARVLTKIMVALPRELHPLQRAKLIRAFAERITQGRAPWFAAIHQHGKDVGNPHAHLAVRDRDPETGQRVARLSEKGACDRVRQLWEQACNEALRRAARPERVDRRSHRAKGLQGLPERHRGAFQHPSSMTESRNPRGTLPSLALSR
jgi:hypothetical protein